MIFVGGNSMGANYQKLQQVIDFGLEIEQIQDLELLLERVLSSSRALANADAGTIYMKHDDSLIFSQSQNDTLQQRQPAGIKLIYKTFTVPINRRSIAGYVASTGETVNIPDAYLLNGNVPYSFDRSFDEKVQYRTQSMLAMALKNTAGEVIGVIQLINARDEQGRAAPFVETDIPLVRILADNAAMAIERAQKTRTEILEMIRFLTDTRDPEETEAHVHRVGAFSVKIYEAWAVKKGISPEEMSLKLDVLNMAAMLHDIGKLSIPQSIRQKSGRFTAEEYDIMKQHTVKGAKMLLTFAQTPYEIAAAEIALNHHEYWNGSGYPGHINLESGQPMAGYENEQGAPRGKHGEEIPAFGRVVAIADVYDALSCRRAFRDAMKEDDVLRTLEKGAGRHFDPDMIDAFFSSLDAIRAIRARFPDNDDSASG